MIQLTDGFDRFLQPPIVAQPPAHLRNLPALNAELSGAAARIADRQNCLAMSFTAGAPGAAAGVAGSALDQGTAQHVGYRGKTFQEPLVSLNSLFRCQLSRWYILRFFCSAGKYGTGLAAPVAKQL